MNRRSLYAFVLCLVLVPSIGAAQQKGPAPADDFTTLMARWKQNLARFSAVRQQYQNDKSADKQALMAEAEQLREQAMALIEPLKEAAKKAYAAAPNQDQQVSDFLIASLSDSVTKDDYENAAEVAQLLVDNNCDHQALDLLAGLAFFNTNDYEAAEKHLKAASEKGVINDSGARYLGMVDKYKEMWSREKTLREAEEGPGLPPNKQLPQVKLETTKGDIVLTLFENQAPNTVANFINLVERGFYDGLNFHRVIPGFMAQGGDPSGDGSGGPGFTIPDECRQENHRKHFRGSLSMAKTAAPDSGGSQFFLTFVPTPHLDGKHTVFGHVTEGMDVLAELERTEPQPPEEIDKITRATVVRKRVPLDGRNPYANPIRTAE